MRLSFVIINLWAFLLYVDQKMLRSHIENLDVSSWFVKYTTPVTSHIVRHTSSPWVSLLRRTNYEPSFCGSENAQQPYRKPWCLLVVNHDKSVIIKPNYYVFDIFLVDDNVYFKFFHQPSKKYFSINCYFKFQWEYQTKNTKF